MQKRVWLYFNTQADDDNIGTGAPSDPFTNAMYPAENLLGIKPITDNRLKFTFKSIINDASARRDTIVVQLQDDNTHLDVIKNITRAINNTTPTFDGFICIADDLVTKVDGTTVRPEYITDNRQDPGFITSIASISIFNYSRGNGTTNSFTAALAAGVNAGDTQLTQGGYYNVGSDADNKILTLPAPVKGTVVWLDLEDATNKYELMCKTPATTSINGGAGTNYESSIPTATSLVRCICVKGEGSTSGAWICTQWTSAGVESAVEIANAP